ncbi:MAG: sigma-70 family RNA polymerase sigma factor [Deltaproteobacteria bacterium]|nr:MAG: sigma-70 family RNA polymerase sigma factor [Deltaproteobacteria bacterium]
MSQETKTWSDGQRTYTIEEIATLVAAIKENRQDLEAVTALYQSFVHEIYRFFRNRVHSVADVHDLTSETFVIMLRNIDKLEQNQSFHSWLFGIALNLLRKYYKRKKREIEEICNEGNSDFQRYLAQTTTPPPMPDIVVDRKHLRIYIGELMSKMKQEQQMVLYLRFYEEMRIREIAEIMQKSEEAIKSLLFRSQKKLHKLLLKKFRTGLRNPAEHYAEILRSFADA